MIVTPSKLPCYHYDDTFDLSLIKRDLRELNSKEQEKFLDDYPYIGPHEGKSLSLILLGKKALYIGARDYILEELKPYIKNEEIIVHNSKYLDKKEKTYTICRSDCNYYFEMAKDNIKQIKLIMHSYYKRDKKISNNKINELLTHDRSLGRLLGYFEADIEAYCEKRKWNLRNGLSL